MTAMAKITPCLWFDNNAEEAANFYVTLLPDSRIVEIVRSTESNRSGSAGAALVVKFTLGGQNFAALNAGPQVKLAEPSSSPTTSSSFTIDCDDQAEIDRLWDSLTSEGGDGKVCGWLKDRYGMSWQILPKMLPQLVTDPSDPARAARVMQAMIQMSKLDIAKLSAA